MLHAMHWATLGAIATARFIVLTLYATMQGGVCATMECEGSRCRDSMVRLLTFSSIHYGIPAIALRTEAKPYWSAVGEYQR